MIKLENPQPELYWAIGEIAPTENEIKEFLAPQQELSELARFSFPQRRLEWLAVRALAFQVSQKLDIGLTNILKDENNCPFLVDSAWKISLSHKNNICGVAFSKRALGLDIEHTHPRVQKAAPRILSPKEQDLAQNLEDLTFLWAAKEALYKLYGKKGLDFIQDIQIGFEQTWQAHILGKAYPLYRYAHQDYQIALAG